jgi:hypothetical protein
MPGNLEIGRSEGGNLVPGLVFQIKGLNKLYVIIIGLTILFST